MIHDEKLQLNMCRFFIRWLNSLVILTALSCPSLVGHEQDSLFVHPGYFRPLQYPAVDPGAGWPFSGVCTCSFPTVQEGWVNRNAARTAGWRWQRN